MAMSQTPSDHQEVLEHLTIIDHLKSEVRHTPQYLFSGV